MIELSGLPTLVELERPDTWPDPLVNFLNAHYQLFLGWEQHTGGVSSQEYDRAIYGDVLRAYAIRGWHCTRLTDAEIAAIEIHGMQLPDATMLDRRIDAVALAGGLTNEIAAGLKARNQAHEPNRAGRVWFCFFPPRHADDGCADFFRYWGGEALYNSHDRDPVTAEIISTIGTPCIVEADVPIALFGTIVGLSFKVVRRYLVNRGLTTTQPLDHEDRITFPLPPNSIRPIIRFPSPEFIDLTGCTSWHNQLPPLSPPRSSLGR